MRILLSSEHCGYIEKHDSRRRHYRLDICDLVPPQYVGRALVRCMRTFIYPALSGVHLFHNVYYLPVEKRTFKSIRIEILQLTGKPVEFKTSTTPSKLVLHFRRVSAW